MTYWKLLVSVLIIIVVGIALFLFFSSRGTSTGPATTSTGPRFGQPAQNIPLPNQTLSPTAFATNFYTWYLQGLMNDQTFDGSDQFKSTINNWLTPDFIANWSTIVENTDANPVLLAQDYANSWSTNVNTSVVSQTATTITVLVSLGISSELKKLTVELVRITDGTWRIASVTPAL